MKKSIIIIFSIVLAILFVFAGTLATPTSKIPVSDNGSSQTTEITSDNSSIANSAISENTDNNTSEEENTSKPADNISKPPASAVGTGKAEPINLSNIPSYSGKAYIIIKNNIPNFSATELKTNGYEFYSNLDSLGRTRTAIASVGKDTMPKQNEDRGSISSIKPTGWKQAKYDFINGGWLYNRCHLIGWQLSAENTNKSNLITGTKYLNINGMLPFENMVADYIKETGNNLLASGGQMEAYSVEDNGAGICFNVYCYNVQPNVIIDYATGESSGA